MDKTPYYMLKNGPLISQPVTVMENDTINDIY
jgi:hypothetical protein